MCLGGTSSRIQLWLILHPNCFTNLILSFLYFIDLLVYTINPQRFLTARSKSLGLNYASLGKIITGEYAECADIISKPQSRGFYLGRARLNQRYVHKKFLLSLSDQSAGGTGLHATLHEHVWRDLAPYAERIIERDAAQFDKYILDGLKGDDYASFLKMAAKCIFHAFSGEAPSSAVVNAAVGLFIKNSPTSSYIGGALNPVAKFIPNCLRGKRRKQLKTLTDFFLASPLMQDGDIVKPEFEMKSNAEYAELLAVILGLAGTLGTGNLCLNVVQRVPKDANIDLNNDHEVLLAMLEAARINAPVNNINVILTEEKSMTINNKVVTLPIGSVVAGSIGLASVDPNQFENPLEFNHLRDNLMSYILNFNSVGFDKIGLGTRVCPGRNVALTIVKKVLFKSRDYTPPTLPE